jgi:hypothetical protein
MELITSVKPGKSPFRITYDDPVMFIGSCFASSIGSKLLEGKMPVMINPAGTVYNPVSVLNTLELITSGKRYSLDSLFFHNGVWLSFSHYTEFSSVDPETTLGRINTAAASAEKFISKAKYLFITFGTARVFRLKQTGQIVSNCHRLPAASFERELLTVNEITSLWKRYLDLLAEKYPALKIVFTISPVRHWKDGAHGNQVSKSVLFLAVEELLGHSSSPGYFPAYEIMMDELRDYRYYADDMLHPSQLAVDYIFEEFAASYLDEKILNTYREISRVSRAMKHRLNENSGTAASDFAKSMLDKIARIERDITIDFTTEKKYFTSLL